MEFVPGESVQDRRTGLVRDWLHANFSASPFLTDFYVGVINKSEVVSRRYFIVLIEDAWCEGNWDLVSLKWQTTKTLEDTQNIIEKWLAEQPAGFNRTTARVFDTSMNKEHNLVVRRIVEWRHDDGGELKRTWNTSARLPHIWHWFPKQQSTDELAEEKSACGQFVYVRRPIATEIAFPDLPVAPVKNICQACAAVKPTPTT